MMTTKDRLREHFEQVFTIRDGSYYFGTLSKESSDPETQGRVIILKKDVRGIPMLSGHLDMRKPKRCSVSYITDDETLDLQFAPGKLEIMMREPQITKKEPIFGQSIHKEDWITPQPIKIRYWGNYESQMRALNMAFERFKKQGPYELWLPLQF